MQISIYPFRSEKKCEKHETKMYECTVFGSDSKSRNYLCKKCKKVYTD